MTKKREAHEASWPPDYHLLSDAADPYGRRRRRREERRRDQEAS